MVKSNIQKRTEKMGARKRTNGKIKNASSAIVGQQTKKL